MLVISVDGGYNRRANNERTPFTMATSDKLDVTPPTPMLTWAGKKWLPAEPLEGRSLGAVKRSATARGMPIIGADMPTGGTRTTMTSRGMTSKAGNGKATPGQSRTRSTMPARKMPARKRAMASAR